MNQTKLKNTYSILNNWWETIDLSNYEKSIFNKEIISFNQQLIRLKEKKIRIGVFGKAGVGKSSILNSILEYEYFETSVLNGLTKEIKSEEIYLQGNALRSCELIDYPGFDICNLPIEGNHLKDIYAIDLIIFIISGDINRNELKELSSFINCDKKVVIVFNKADNFNNIDIRNISLKIKQILPNKLEIPIIINSNKKNDNKLRSYILNILDKVGDDLLINNTFQLVDKLSSKIKEIRLIKRKKEAQSIIGKFATIKASSVALNPLIFIDVAGSFALDTVLIKELSKIYGLQVKGMSAQKLLQTISLNNFFLGATQIGINFSFNLIKKIILLSAPFTSGMSLLPYGPVAIAQAALAVKATKLIGKMAAKEILNKSIINGLDPFNYINEINLKNFEVIASYKIYPYNKEANNDLSIFMP